MDLPIHTPTWHPVLLFRKYSRFLKPMDSQPVIATYLWFFPTFTWPFPDSRGFHSNLNPDNVGPRKWQFLMSGQTWKKVGNSQAAWVRNNPVTGKFAKICLDIALESWHAWHFRNCPNGNYPGSSYCRAAGIPLASHFFWCREAAKLGQLTKTQAHPPFQIPIPKKWIVCQSLCLDCRLKDSDDPP